MRLIRSDMINLFKSRGVPISVLLAQHPGDITRHINLIEVPRSEGSMVLEKKKQLAAIQIFERIIGADKNSSKKPFMLIASRSYDFIALQYALLICANLMQNSGKNFWWHSVYGNTQDDLRDNDTIKSKIKDINLLILGNVADNSTAMKVEKVRDILTMYSNIPRILTVGGVEPVSYSKQVLKIKPDFFVSC